VLGQNFFPCLVTSIPRLAVSSLTSEDYPHVVGVFVRVWIRVRTLLLNSVPICFWFCDCNDVAYRSRFKRKRFSRHRSVTPPSRPDAVLVICVSIVALYCPKIADRDSGRVCLLADGSGVLASVPLRSHERCRVVLRACSPSFPIRLPWSPAQAGALPFFSGLVAAFRHHVARDFPCSSPLLRCSLRDEGNETIANRCLRRLKFLCLTRM
jgi:hypothetical protein